MRDETLGPGAWKFWLSISFAFVSFAALNSCGSRYESYAVESGPQYQMECMDTHDMAGILMTRCENLEVVCYRYSVGGVSCAWKEDRAEMTLRGDKIFRKHMDDFAQEAY